MYLKKLVISLSLLLASFNFLNANNSINLGFTEKTFEAEVGVYINDYYVLDSGSDYYLDFGGFTSEVQGQSPIFHLGFRVASPFSNEMGVSFAFGFRGIMTEHDDDVFVAVPIVFFLRNEVNDQINISSRFMYSPTILNMLEAERYTEGRVQVNYALVDNNVFLFGGYRYIYNIYRDFNNTPTRGVYIGAQIRY